MNFFECVFIAAICFGAVNTSRLSSKYLPPTASGSSHYPSYHGAASRVSPNLGHQYAAADSAAVYTASHYGKNRVPPQIPILRNEYRNDGNGNYGFGFETGNGIKRDESGNFKGSWPGGSLKVSGSYSYTGDDGKLYSVNYKADSNGFHAEGDHLPTPPPIPREIQETLHLHQHGGSQRVSVASHAPPSSYSRSGHHVPAGNFAATSHLSDANVRAPNANYLPPHQGQGYNYGRHY